MKFLLGKDIFFLQKKIILANHFVVKILAKLNSLAKEICDKFVFSQKKIGTKKIALEQNIVLKNSGKKKFVGALYIKENKKNYTLHSFRIVENLIVKGCFFLVLAIF